MPALLLLTLLLAPAPDDPAARAAELLAREDEVIDALDDLDRRIAEIALEQARLGVHRADRARALAEVDTRLTAARARVTAARARLAARLRARARLAAAAERLPTITARPTDALRRRGIMRAVLRHDADAIHHLRADEAALRPIRAERAAAAAALDTTDAELAAQRQLLEDERATRARLLATVRRERRLAERLATARSARLQALPLALALAPAQGFAEHRGQLPPPVLGRLTTRFGRATDPELGTVTFNTGVGFDAPYGAPVRAVHRGRVVYSGWYKGFGNLVIIDHGDDHHTLYGHLSAIRRARGETVDTGDIIGEVGDAGSLSGPKLHFELRARRAPVDPIPWLRSDR